jgi:ribosomal protein L40E
MLLKCAKCGFENQLGAIFCRNCGAKLNLEELRPKVVDRDGGFSVLGLLRKLLGLVVFVGLVGIIVAMFVPASEVLYPSLSDNAEQEVARTKIKNLINRIDEEMGDKKYVFSASEATFIYNDTFIAKVEGETAGAYAVEKLAFRVDQHGFINILLVTKLAGKIPVTFEIRGSPVNPSGDEVTPVSFVVSECKMGRMPVKFLENKVIEKFLPALSGGNADKIMKVLKSVVVTDDKNFEISVK